MEPSIRGALPVQNSLSYLSVLMGIVHSLFSRGEVTILGMNFEPPLVKIQVHTEQTLMHGGGTRTGELSHTHFTRLSRPS